MVTYLKPSFTQQTFPWHKYHVIFFSKAAFCVLSKTYIIYRSLQKYIIFWLHVHVDISSNKLWKINILIVNKFDMTPHELTALDIISPTWEGCEPLGPWVPVWAWSRRWCSVRNWGPGTDSPLEATSSSQHHAPTVSKYMYKTPFLQHQICAMYKLVKL